MNAIAAYSGALLETLNRAFDTQADALREGARLLKEATLGGRNIFAFGCSHAILPMLEMYYRTGGMATINPVRAPGLCLDVDPATMTSAMEPSSSPKIWSHSLLSSRWYSRPLMRLPFNLIPHSPDRLDVF